MVYAYRIHADIPIKFVLMIPHSSFGISSSMIGSMSSRLSEVSKVVESDAKTRATAAPKSLTNRRSPYAALPETFPHRAILVASCPLHHPADFTIARFP
jgi:hypothetical protein